MSAPDITADFLSKPRTNGRFARNTLRSMDSATRYLVFCMLVQLGVRTTNLQRSLARFVRIVCSVPPVI